MSETEYEIWKPVGSVFPDEFVFELKTKGSVYLYSYNWGRRAFRLRLYWVDDRCFCTNLDGSEKKSFDLNGFLHTFSTDTWNTIVFTNCWHAYGYEQNLKQAARSLNDQQKSDR